MKARYTPARVARKLKAMLGEPRLAQQAKRVAEQLKHEDGVKTACDALEELHSKSQRKG